MPNPTKITKLNKLTKTHVTQKKKKKKIPQIIHIDTSIYILILKTHIEIDPENQI